MTKALEMPLTTSCPELATTLKTAIMPTSFHAATSMKFETPEHAGPCKKPVMYSSSIRKILDKPAFHRTDNPGFASHDFALYNLRYKIWGIISFISVANMSFLAMYLTFLNSLSEYRCGYCARAFKEEAIKCNIPYSGF